MKIYKTDLSTEVYIEEDCYIVEIINDPSEELSIARSRVLPGVTTRLHSLSGTKEVYYILEGEGLVTVDDESAMLTKGDSVVIFPGVPQLIENTGQDDLIFLCICLPRFQMNNYKDLR